MKILKVAVTDKNAVYINDTRITGRHTKWGIHTIVDEFTCNATDVSDMLKKRGHDHVVLDADYAKEFNIVV